MANQGGKGKEVLASASVVVSSSAEGVFADAFRFLFRNGEKKKGENEGGEKNLLTVSFAE